MRVPEAGTVLAVSERPQQNHMCATCHRVLDHHSLFGWQHSEVDSPADHPVVPVPVTADEVESRCDFCSGDRPEFLLPADDFEVMKGHVSHGAWSACAHCAALISENNWSGLVARAATVWAKKERSPMPQKVRNSLTVMFGLLRKHITGPLEPMPR